MQEYLLVDGYNIIGAWPELYKLRDINLEEARDRLVEILADYQAFSGMKVIVVFDAHQVPGVGGKYKQYQVQIQYTREKETADECIERLVSEFSRRRVRIHVATSDYVEQHVIFDKGALRISARELLVKIQQSHKEVKSRISDHTTKKRNTFDSKLSQDLLDILEKWRRGQ